MPNNLTDDPSQYASQLQVPAAGDPRTDTSVATTFQQIANRTGNITSRLNAIAAPTQLGYSPALPAGVTVGSVSLNATSVAAMQSIPAANRVDGMTCVVKDLETFQFDIVSTTTAVANQIVQPSDVIGGAPGRWVVQPAGLYGVANGIAQLDASARLVAATVRNGLIYDKAATGSLVTSSLQAIATVTLPGLLVGDLIKFNGSVLANVTASQSASTQVNILDPFAGDAAIDGGSNNLTAPAGVFALAGVRVPVNGTFTVVNAGTHNCRLMVSGNGATCTFQFACLNVTVSRP